MKKLQHFTSFIFFGLILICLNTKAQNFYWAGASADWSSPSNWLDAPGGLPYAFAPGAGATVYIDLDLLNGNTITISGNVDVLNIIAYGSGSSPLGKIRINGSHIVTVNGNIDLQQTMDISGPTNISLIPQITLKGNGVHSVRSSGTHFNNIRFSLNTDGAGSYTFLDNFKNTSGGNFSMDILKGNWVANGITFETTRLQSSGLDRHLDFQNCAIIADRFSIAGGFVGFNDSNSEWVIKSTVTTNGGGEFRAIGTATQHFNAIRFTQPYGTLVWAGGGISGLSFGTVIVTNNLTISAAANSEIGIESISVLNQGTITIGGTGNISGPAKLIDIANVNVPGTCDKTVAFVGQYNQVAWELLNDISVNYCSFFKIRPENFTINGNFNSVDMGQNYLPGFINLSNLPKKYYWCGNNSSDWADGQNWSLFPGTCIPAGCIPTILDTVVIDNTHILAGGTGATNMQLSGSGFCASMFFDHNLTFTWSGSGNFYLSQDIKLAPPAFLNNNFGGTFYFINDSIQSPSLITSQGNSFRCFLRTNGTGGYHLQDSLNSVSFSGSVRNITHRSGAFRTMGHKITCQQFIVDNNTMVRELDIVNSTMNLTLGSVSVSNIVLDVNAEFLNFFSAGSIINISGQNAGLRVSRNQASTQFNIINYTNPLGVAGITNLSLSLGGNSGIQYPIRMHQLNLKPAAEFLFGSSGVVNILNTDILSLNAGREYRIPQNKSIKVENELVLPNSCLLGFVTLKGIGGTANFNTGSLFNHLLPLEFISIDNVTANSGSGDTVFISNSIVNNNTSGWQGLSSLANTFYWIGEGANSNWSNAANWSLSPPSQGVDIPAGCIPGPNDDVVFLNDDAFFHNVNVADKIVLVDVHAFCRNMYWGDFDSAQMPTFTVSLPNPSALNINGSLHFSQTMNHLFSGFTIFNSANPSETIRTNGNLFKNTIFFRGQAVYSLLDELKTTVSNSPSNHLNYVNIIIESGGIISNGNAINCYGFQSDFTSSRTIEINNSDINLFSNQASAWIVNSTNLQFNADNSFINFITPVTGLPRLTTRGNNPLTYNHVSFYTPGEVAVAMNGVIIKRLYFGNNSSITTSTGTPITIDIDTLVYSPGTVNSLHIGGNHKVKKLISNGINCSQIVIRSSVTGTFANLCNIGSDTFNLRNVNIYDIRSDATVCIGATIPNTVWENSSLVNAPGWSANPANLGGFSFPSSLTLNCSDFPYLLSTESYYNPGTDVTFNWNNSGITSDASLLVNQPGNQKVDIYFTPTCIISDSVFIQLNDNLNASFTKNDVTCHDSNTGSISVVLDNHSLVYNYHYYWSHGLPDSSFVTDLLASNYNLTITDEYNNCSTDLLIQILEPDSFFYSSSFIEPSCYGFSDGEISISIAGGTPHYTYALNGMPVDTGAYAVFQNLTSGSYLFQLTDANNCIDTLVLELLQPELIDFSTQLLTPLPICYGSNVLVEVPQAELGYTYQLRNNFSPVGSPLNGNNSPLFFRSDNIIQNTAEYNILVTDSNGCSRSKSIDTISVKPIPTTLAINNDVRTCYLNGNNDFVEFYTDNGIMLSINPGLENLGFVTVTEYVEPPVNIQACGTIQPWFVSSALGRHWLINPEFQPTQPVDIRLYLNDDDFIALSLQANSNSNPLDDISSVFSLGLSKYSNESNPGTENGSYTDNCSGGNTSLYLTADTGAINQIGIHNSFPQDGRFIEYNIPSFSEFWLSGTGGISPLPVSMISFDAECSGSTVLLSWSTASELNNSHFRVSRSTDLISWESIGIVLGAGNSNTLVNYTLVDERPLDGMAYYRLIQTDYDGSESIFEPLGIICQMNSIESGIILYPNPAESSFTVAYSLKEAVNSASLYILDLNGKCVNKIIVPGSAGINKIQMDRDGLNPGTYFVQFRSESFVLPAVKLILN